MRPTPKPKPAPKRRTVEPISEAELAAPVPSLDAEDIALARLQAQLRRKELIAPERAGGGALARAMIRLPSTLLARTKQRAERDGVPVSEVVQRALEKFLR